ncbi:MAG: hypothetical protein RIC03_14455 [Cyclobacteriaceae bacterium]
MRTFLILFSIIAYSQLFAQGPSLPKDNPQARLEFEIEKTKDPKTGRIPFNIKTKERDFMQRAFSSSARVAGAGDNAVPWYSRGPINQGGRTRALKIDVDNESTILAGGVSGGMWKSTNQGTSWSKTTGSDELQSVTCLAQDLNSTNNDTWYYGTGEWSGNSAGATGAAYQGNGIYKSTDNGQTWVGLSATQTTTPESFTSDFNYVHEIVVDPTNGDVYAATYDAIYKSDDGGASFEIVLGGSGNKQWSDIVVSSTGLLYATINTMGVYRSSDGVTWTQINSTGGPSDMDNGERVELALAPSNENLLYLIAEDDAHASGYILYLWNESNDTWTNRSNQIPQLGGATGDFDSQGGYDLLVSVKNDDPNVVVIGGTNLFRSTDGFATTGNTDWIGGYENSNSDFGLYTSHHPDQHSFAWLSNDDAISGNDGGLQLTTNIVKTNLNSSGEAVDWTPLNNGYLTTQVYAVSVGPGDQIMAGFQDNGTWLTNSTNGTENWGDPFGGDGSYSAWSSDGTTRWLSSQNGSLLLLTYSDADDLTYNGFTQPYSPTGYTSGSFIAAMYVDPKNDNLLYLGGDNTGVLWVNTQAKTGDEATGWKSIALTGSTDRISEIGTTNTEGMLYIGTSGGKIFKITNAGGNASVAEISTGTGFPRGSGYISGVTVNAENSNEILVSFSNYSVRSLWHTTNGGANWSDVSGNLEENADGSGSGTSVRTVGILANGLRYFAGTSTGLYSTNSLNGTSTVWVQESSSDIGQVVVEHMVVRSTDGLVVAGTHGNGVFSAKYEVNATPTFTAFSGVLATTSLNKEVEITFTEMTAKGDEADTDGTVQAFVVQSVTNGTLKIGASAGSATAFSQSGNALINASNNAYWTPATNATGASIAAFEVIAQDNNGGKSSQNVAVNLSVSAASIWNGATSSDWGTASNWNTGVVPTSGDNIVVDNVAKDPIVDGDFAINNLTLNSGATLTVKSGSSLVILGTVSGTGAVKANRTVSANTSSLYSMISSPVTTATISSLGASIIYTHDGADFQAVNGGNMVAGEGYFVFFENGQPQNVALTGTPNSGNVTVSLPAGQFKIVGNPYLAAIDYNSFPGTNTTGNIWIWDDAGTNGAITRNGDYVTINTAGVTAAAKGATGNSWNGHIGSLQGFFVEGDADGGDLTFTPAMQTLATGNNGENNHFRDDSDLHRIKLSLSGNDLYNETMVALSPFATYEKDYGLDAKKIKGNPLIAFYSLQDNQPYAIQGLPVPHEKNEVRVQLGIDLAEEATYKISLVEEDISADYEMLLLDKVSGKTHDLRLAQNIDFQSGIVTGSNRFELIFRKAEVLVVNEIGALNLKVYGNAQGLKIRYHQDGTFRTNVYALDGTQVFSGSVTVADQQAELPFQLKRNRIYILKINNESVKFVIQ